MTAEWRAADWVAADRAVGWGAAERSADGEASHWGASSARSARAIDRAFLARITRGDQALEREVLMLFCAQLPLILQRLGTGSGRNWTDAAHTIKGSAAAIGAWPLARAAARAEAVDAADPGARAEAIAALSRAATELCRDIARSWPRR